MDNWCGEVNVRTNKRNETKRGKKKRRTKICGKDEKRSKGVIEIRTNWHCLYKKKGKAFFPIHLTIHLYMKWYPFKHIHTSYRIHFKRKIKSNWNRKIWEISIWKKHSSDIINIVITTIHINTTHNTLQRTTLWILKLTQNIHFPIHFT